MPISAIPSLLTSPTAETEKPEVSSATVPLMVKPLVPLRLARSNSSENPSSLP